MKKKPSYEDLEKCILELENHILNNNKRDHVPLNLSQLSKLYKTMYEGVCINEMLFDDKNDPIDYRIVDTNPSYEVHTGIKKEDAVGKLASKLYGTGKPPYLDIFGNVFKTKTVEKLETYFPPMNKHFSISIVPLGEKFFATVFHDITALKLTEKNLIHEKEKLQILTDSIGAGLIIISKDYKTVWNNKVITDIFGDVIGKTCYETYNGRKSICPSCGVKKIFEENLKVAVYEQRGIDVKGNEIWSKIIGSPIYNENGEVESVLEVVIPITEEKKSALTIKESQIKYKTLFEEANDAIYLVDPTTRRIIDCNKKALKMDGYSLLQMQNMTIEELHPENEIEFLQKKFAKGIEEGKVSNIRGFNHKTRDGRIIPVEISASHFEINGKPFNLSILRDVSEQNEINEKLSLFKKFAENSNQGCVWANLEDAGIEYMNRALCDILNVNDFKDIKGKSFFMFYQNKDKKHFQNKVISQLLAGKNVTSEKDILQADGTLIPVLENLFFIKSEDNQPKYIAAVITDLSDVKKNESDRLKTKNLESLSDLSSGIAHDFNNLLVAVFGNIELALDTKGVPEEAQRCLNESKKAIRAAKKLTGRLMTFSKTSSEKKMLVSIAELAKETANFLLSGSNIRSKITSDDNLLKIEIDYHQIEILLTQLVLNAKESMKDAGYITINIENKKITDSSQLQLPPDNYIHFSIKDEGSGISKNFQNKIFDPYFSTKTRSSEKGTGLGLALCHSIVSRNKGLITIESSPGKGSTFHIYLPAFKNKKSDEKKDLKNKGLILLLEDEAFVSDVVKKILSKFGYECIVTKTGEETIEKYNSYFNYNKPFDVVILDLTIPGGMGGVDTLKKLLTINPDVKAIATSGYTESSKIENYNKFGFSAALTKPFLFKTLKTTLDELMKN